MNANIAARPPQRLVFLLWFLLMALAAYRVADLSIFMLDAERTEHALDPPRRSFGDESLDKAFYPRHNCFTCYLVAADLASADAENLYLGKQYRDASEKTVIHTTIGDAFGVDSYHYPPPFLLLPQALLAAGLDFFSARTAWYFLNLLMLLVTVVALVIWLGDPGFSPRWFVLPVLLLATTTLTTLQIGNVHLMLVCCTLLALLAFEARHDWLGGMLLAFAVVTKLFPALFLLYLLARRRWQAVAWTAAGVALLCSSTLLLFGSAPFHAFGEYQLPRLLSGEAFSFATKSPLPMLVNQSLSGTIYKLRELGLAMDAPSVAQIAGWAYAALLAVLAFISGMRHGSAAATAHLASRPVMVRAWIGLFILLELRSPFLPWGYGAFPVLLLAALLLPTKRPLRLGLLLALVTWLLFAFTLPLPFGPADIQYDHFFTVAAFGFQVILCLVLLMRPVRAPTMARGA